MKKIMVIGSAGSGKTYFSRKLSEKLGIPLIHLDKIYWRPRWEEPTKEEWRTMLEKELSRDSWIIDGNYGATIEMRLAACDTVFFLDIRRTLCMWRVIRRTFRFIKRSRPDMAENCPERLNLEFLSFIWNYPERSKPKIERLLNSAEKEKKIFRLRSPRQVRRFLRTFEKDI
jgi:adenylate kinase family enzyme